MPTSSPTRVKVVLHWLQILDKLDPAWEEHGEFRFTARFSDGQGNVIQETRFPEEGHYALTDKSGWNKYRLDKVLFDGPVESDEFVVELLGEELDFLTANDMLAPYKRVFRGSPQSWIGRYCPGDEDPDPENMSNWRVCYEIMPA